MAHKTLSELSKTSLFEIVSYVHKNHNLLPYSKGKLAPILQEKKIIEKFIVYGEVCDKSVVAELSKDQLLCIAYYQRINGPNVLKRLLWKIILNIFHKKRVEKIYRQYQELEEKIIS